VTTIVALAAVTLFMAAFFYSGIVAVAKRALATMNSTFATIRDPEVDDSVREKAAQCASLGLLRATGSIALRAVLTLAVSGVPIVLADLGGLAPRESVVEFLVRWDVIVGLSVLITAGWIIAKRI
jgi:hypothetical protein